ncbi:schlafen family member 13-like [Octodon degus]|uniref:Schlafen family member 13-like n=1 Tax=Octodon degus TaxID=10160 RepID=A0A6P3VBQ4_OCTDE|nr:schlafen family member 13-like [Octodon degus]
MQIGDCSLVLQPSQPDLVLNVGRVTLGEEYRQKQQKFQRDKEKKKVVLAACALLNSGGGVIQMEMANEADHPLELGLDLEQALRELIPSSDVLQAFFETRQQGRFFHIFVKSWSNAALPEDNCTKPRICSVSSSLYRRSGTSTICLDLRQAYDFLKTQKRKAQNTLLNEESEHSKILRAMHQDIMESNSPFQVFQSNKIEYGHILPFPESHSVEFKQFSTQKTQEYVKRVIQEYIPAFANTGGGYLFIGVHDKSRRVLGCAKENIDPDSLQRVIAQAISKLPVFHFCSTDAQVFYEIKVIDVFKNENLYGYLIIVNVEPFCCVVFSEDPASWMVKEQQKIVKLNMNEWVAKMMNTDPDLPEAFESQLTLSDHPAYCREQVNHKTQLQQHLFPVSPGRWQYIPETLWMELSSQHKGLEELIHQQVHPASWGILIFSRSWAVDLGLEEKQGVLCDALLIAHNRPPTLYTILGDQDAEGQDYCNRIALTLKQKLVTMGGYTGKLCVMTKVLCLNPNINAVSLEMSSSQIHYPWSYNFVGTQQMESFLQALMIVLLGFRSLLRYQPEKNSYLSNFHHHSHLFVHDLPVSGKATMAMKIRDRNIRLYMEAEEVENVCEDVSGKTTMAMKIRER